MAFDISDTLDVIWGHVAASGYVSSSGIGEPVGPPEGDKIHGAVYMRNTIVTALYLDGTQEVHVPIIRLYWRVPKEPPNTGELELAQAAAALFQDLVEDFTLGGTIREIDIAGGKSGEGISTDWGHVEISNVVFRTIDITVPVVVDDAATPTA